jgi:hypothetical protein
LPTQTSIDLALDRHDRIHILYQDGSRLLWRHRTSPGDWRGPTQVAADLTSKAQMQVRVRADQVGFAYRPLGGGVGYLQVLLP